MSSYEPGWEHDELRDLVARASALADAVGPDVTEANWSPHETAELVAAATRLHAAAVVAAECEVPLDDDRLSATDAVIVAGALLRATDLNAFDLSLWLSRAPQGPR